MTAAVAPVASSLLRRKAARRSAGALVLLVIGAGLLLPLSAVLLVAGSGMPPNLIAGPGGLPAAARPWVPVVNRAGAAYDVNPYLLLAILSVETAYGTNPDTYGVNFLGCCYGPFQFNMVDGPPSTWDMVKDAYRRSTRPAGYLHPAGPHPSPYDSFDAAMAAALLLRRKAGNRPLTRLDRTAWEAVRAYNGTGAGADAYADSVLATARELAATALEPGASSDGQLRWPITGPVVSGFGTRWGRLHAGIDIAAPTGTPIAAAASGRVILRGWVSGYGRFTCLEHTSRLATCYAHQSAWSPAIAVGQPVGQGEVIGRVGCTGHCFGPHLHFEVHTSTRIDDSTAVDPMRFLPSR